MDYVVFGIGMGASLVLLGLAGRAVGPSLRYRRSSETGDVLKAEELVARIAWSRFCGSLGAAIAIGGLFLLIVTGITMAIRIDDTAAAVAVGLALLAIVVLMAVWTWAFVDRFGLYGVVASEPRIREPRPQKTEKPKKQTPVKTAAQVTTLKSEKPLTPKQPVVAASSEPEQPKLSAAKRAFQPWSTPAEPDPQPEVIAPPTRPVTTADPSRSEVINPSDAAALDRILSEPDPESPVESILESAEEAIGESSEEAATEPETPIVDPHPVPAAPWNTRKHQRR